MKTHQFTVRSVPDSISRELRRKARARGVSLNSVLVSALQAAVGRGAEPSRHHDLDALAGTWVADPAVESALSEQRRVDERDWR